MSPKWSVCELLVWSELIAASSDSFSTSAMESISVNFAVVYRSATDSPADDDEVVVARHVCDRNPISVGASQMFKRRSLDPASDVPDVDRLGTTGTDLSLWVARSHRHPAPSAFLTHRADAWQRGLVTHNSQFIHGRYDYII
jgi:hypothetical protein